MLTLRSLGFRCALLVCTSVFALLSGCGGMGDDESPTSTPAGAAVGTSVPTISLSGTPPTSVVAGNLYVFQPTASTTSGTATFSASGLPSWASINSSTGEISGTPTTSNVGSTGDITISASDGSATASLTPFKVDVTAAAAGTGSASLSWTIPTLNTNGTPATDLAGYHIYYGTNPNSLDTVIDVPGAKTTEYEISNLTNGTTYYFAVTAYNSLGVDSADSNEGSKTI
jgi:Putative Ig domain